MRAKPKGAKYRNLYARYTDVIYYQRVVEGQRFRFSCRTNDWNEAAAVARLFEEKKGVGRPGFVIVEPPTFAEMARLSVDRERRRREGLAGTTLRDRTRLLQNEDGPVLRLLGALRVDAIEPETLQRWWEEEVEGRGRSVKTGRSYLDAINGVLRLAQRHGHLRSPNPVPVFRDWLRAEGRTRATRARIGRDIRPIEDPRSLARLLAAAETRGPDVYLLTLLLLDAGLRLGEAAALTWGQVRWGADENDRTRHLLIDRSRPRGGAETPTKSGRDRKVPLSRRLRFALAEGYLRAGRPLLNERVFPRFDVSNFRKREWNELLRGARVGSVRPKDLRDTFASWLLTLGVPAPWVSEALGHADWAVTARHYARWIPGGDDEPLRRRPGEVYPDLLARLAPLDAESDATGRDRTAFPRDLEASFGTRTLDPGNESVLDQ
jgi:integrase